MYLTYKVGDEIRIPKYPANEYSGRITRIEKNTISIDWYIHAGRRGVVVYTYTPDSAVSFTNIGQVCVPSQDKVKNKIDYLWSKSNYAKNNRCLT